MPSTDQKQGCSPRKNGSSRLDKARKQDAYNQLKNSKLRDSKQGKKRQQMSRKIKKRRLISAPVTHIIQAASCSCSQLSYALAVN